jgi:hypothetical protein
MGTVKAQVGRRLTQEEDDALALLWEARQGALYLFIAPEAFNLLRRFTGRIEVDLFLEMVEVMQAGRYFKRWARRLRKYGFAREDAKVLSLGTFSTRKAGDILGADAIVTLDQSFINNYQAQIDALQERLRVMTVNLLPPFCNAMLPVLIQPAEALASLR